VTPAGPAAPSAFALTKWYFDCTAPDGRAAIAYLASLAWRGLSLTWQSVAVYEPGQPPMRRSSLQSAHDPKVDGDRLTWRAPGIGCEIAVDSQHPSIHERLFDDGTGVIDWHVQAPAAAVSVDLEGIEAIRGTGYAERIRMTVPPWRLPIRELRWGRWSDPTASRSVVWIEWRGDLPRTWVYVDGVAATSALVTDDRVSIGTANLVLDDGRTLEAMAFSETAATIPPLKTILPESILALRQTKWCSTGTFEDGSGSPLIGPAIHEVVVFR
jgi:hypothetical protein